MPAAAPQNDYANLLVRDELATCVRSVVADRLGLGVDDLGADVALVDDLAADSLDLVEIALAIETNLGVVLPRHFLDEVRTCGELVDATVTLARRRRRIERHAEEEPVALRARLTPAGAERPWTIERVVLLTPYAAESLADDALRAGAGARLELRLGRRASEATLHRVRRDFSRLGERGIEVRVHRDAGAERPDRDDAA
jgi:acyl carrier protein